VTEARRDDLVLVEVGRGAQVRGAWEPGCLAAVVLDERPDLVFGDARQSRTGRLLPARDPMPDHRQRAARFEEVVDGVEHRGTRGPVIGLSEGNQPAGAVTGDVGAGAGTRAVTDTEFGSSEFFGCGLDPTDSRHACAHGAPLTLGEHARIGVQCHDGVEGGG